MSAELESEEETSRRPAATGGSNCIHKCSAPISDTDEQQTVARRCPHVTKNTMQADAAAEQTKKKAIARYLKDLEKLEAEDDFFSLPENLARETEEDAEIRADRMDTLVKNLEELGYEFADPAEGDEESRLTSTHIRYSASATVGLTASSAMTPARDRTRRAGPAPAPQMTATAQQGRANPPPVPAPRNPASIPQPEAPVQPAAGTEETKTATQESPFLNGQVPTGKPKARDYSDKIQGSRSNARLDIKDAAREVVPRTFNISLSSKKSAKKANQKLVAGLLCKNAFMYKDPEARTGIGEVKVVQDVINASWFAGPRDRGNTNGDLFDPISPNAIAFILSMIEYCLEEYQTGIYVKSPDFTEKQYKPRYVEILKDITAATNSNPNFLRNYDAKLYKRAQKYSGVVATHDSSRRLDAEDLAKLRAAVKDRTGLTDSEHEDSDKEGNVSDPAET
ncbi:unnamed protein product [Peniophora sp. CBMAI 1063]|nr:unnamed protein product [Peniophora sp. CBMAI 1063]